jgi:hypothetical protein
MLSSVLLPQPLGPMIATNSPGATVQVDIVQRAHGGFAAAVDFAQMKSFQSTSRS